MKMVSILIAASLFTSLNASGITTEPPTQLSQGEYAPYFLDCRAITGEVYGELLFLQPNGSSLYYAAQATPLDQSINGGTALQAVSPNWKIFELSPHYAPAFKVGGKILFAPAHTNLEVSWERLYSSKSASKTLSPTADEGTLMIGPLSDIGPNSSAYTKAHGVVHFQFDAVDVVFGQQFCAFTRWYPTLFVGADFVRIKQALKSTYSSANGNSVRSFDASSTFIGAGPKFGLNFDYRIACSLFFSGTSSLGLAIGESKNSVTYKSDSAFLASHSIPEPNVQTTEIPNRTQLIPNFEEKLGFSYIHLFKSWKIKLEAGYQAQIYLNAIQTIDMTAPQVPPNLTVSAAPDSGLYAVGFERTLSNFILTGPYLSLSVDF